MNEELIKALQEMIINCDDQKKLASKVISNINNFVLAKQEVPVVTGDEQAYNYASRLFKSLAPQCEPLDDLMGVLTQLDNYIVGQQAKIDALTQENNQLKSELDFFQSRNK